VAQNRDRWWAVVNAVMNLRILTQRSKSVYKFIIVFQYFFENSVNLMCKEFSKLPFDS
jgi:hypothetical protein